MEEIGQAQARAERHFKVGRPLHAIKLVEVIGKDASISQSFHQSNEDIGRIIDPTEQDCLGEQWNSKTGQLSKGAEDIAIELVWMVDMEHHHNFWSHMLKTRQQALVNPFRDSDGESCMESNSRNMGDQAYLIEKALKRVFRKSQRISAAQNHFIDFSMLLEPEKLLTKARLFFGIVKVAAETKSAVHAAGLRSYKESPCLVLL
jgi:hypothetical protein